MQKGLLPLVSIITPVYNREKLIEETIISVLCQDYPKIEYIVLDDGSTDRTLAVVKKFSGRLSWEHHSNVGETTTVNRGFAMAQGEIIGVINSDDPLLPGAVTNIVRFFQEHPDIMVVYPDWIMINAQGQPVRHFVTQEYDYRNMLRWHSCLPGPGTFFRRQVVKQLKGRDPLFTYVADFEFWLRAGLSLGFARVPMTLATFREHADSSSVRDKGLALAKEHITLVSKIYSLPDLPEEIHKLKREAYSSAFFVAGVMTGERMSIAKLFYFTSAVLLKPLKYIGEYRFRLRTIFKGPIRLWKKTRKFLKKRLKRLRKYVKRTVFPRK